RSAAAPLSASAGRFVAVFARAREAALGAARAAVFLAFFDIFGVPDRAALTGLGRSRKRPKGAGRLRCNWARRRYSPREFARDRRFAQGAKLRHGRFFSVSRGLFEC